MLLKRKLIEDIKDIVDDYYDIFGETFMYFNKTINGYSTITKLHESRSAINRDSEIMPTRWEYVDSQTLIKIKRELENKNVYFLKDRMKIRPKGSKRYKSNRKWEFLTGN